MTNPTSGNGTMSLADRARALLGDAKRFFADELWDSDLTGLPKLKRMLFSLCRIVTIVVKGFLADNCALQASALTYIALMSMVPVLALMFSFSKGMGMQNRLIESIGLEKIEVEKVVDGKPVKSFDFRVIRRGADPDADAGGETDITEALEGGVAAFPEPLQDAVITIFRSVENTNFGALGLVGSLLLFWTAIKAIAKLEKTFNHIWGIHQGRPFLRQLAEYMVILLLIPVAFLVATSLNAALSSPAVVGKLRDVLGPLAGIYHRLIRLSGLAIIGLAFTGMYAFMPNTRVRLFPALVAGFTAGMLWFVVQWLYIAGQISVTKYSTIYGTFAAIPFFLLWLYANWTIVLFGAEVSFAVQHNRTYILEGVSERASPAAREMLGMIVMFEAAKALVAGTGPWSAVEFARRYTIPARLMTGVTRTLVKAKLLVPVADLESCFVPGKDIGHISLADVDSAFRNAGDPLALRFLKLAPGEVRDPFTRQMERFRTDLSATTYRALVDTTP